MKRLIAILLAALVLAPAAYAAGNDFRIRQRNAANTAWIDRDLPATAPITSMQELRSQVGADGANVAANRGVTSVSSGTFATSNSLDAEAGKRYQTLTVTTQDCVLTATTPSGGGWEKFEITNSASSTHNITFGGKTVAPGSKIWLSWSAGGWSGETNSPLEWLANDAPLAPGTAAVGTSPQAAREDHVHPEAVGHSTLTYASSVAIDFTSADQWRTVTLTGDIEFTTSNLSAGKKRLIRIIGDSSERTLTFPADWVFVGTKPTVLAANKDALLSLASFGTANTAVVAGYAVEQ